MLTDFEVEQIEKEAKRLITCTGCYGVGQKHYAKPHEHWEICPTCNGLGRAMAEPKVVELVADLRELKARIAELESQ